MPNDASANGPPLESHRAFLRFLAKLHLNVRLDRVLDADDLVQETLLRAHKAEGVFAGLNHRQQRAWLRTTLLRILLDKLEEVSREKHEVSIDEAVKESSERLRIILEDSESTPLAKTLRNERAAQVENALSQLPERQREAVRLRYWHGQSAAQIAEHLGTTTSAVAGLLIRGLNELGDELTEGE